MESSLTVAGRGTQPLLHPFYRRELNSEEVPFDGRRKNAASKSDMCLRN